MFITLCLLILASSIAGKPVTSLVEQLRNVDWSTKFHILWNNLKSFAIKSGRITTKPLLTFYYVMNSPGTSVLERALIYGGVFYIISPISALPTRVLSWLGILDEAAIIAFIYKKISNKITPIIQQKVQETIDSWFGAEVIEVETVANYK